MSLRFLVESHYARVRADGEYWRPHVEEIARRHGLSMQTYEPTIGDATNAVFFVGDVIVKIYTPYFHGRESRGLEGAALRTLANDPAIPVPRVKASGDLFIGSSDWSWPYVVMTRAQGRVLDADWAELEHDDRAGILRELGAHLARVHKVSPSPELGETYRRLWPTGFHGFIGRQLEALKLSPDLAMLPIKDEVQDLTLVPMGPAWPVLLHGDLEQQHVFHEGPRVTAIIDFGDAKLGDPLYDFVAIRLHLTNGNADLLKAVFEGYGRDPREDDGLRRLSLYSVLHEWTKVGDLSKWCAKSGARSIDDLGRWLWMA